MSTASADVSRDRSPTLEHTWFTKERVARWLTIFLGLGIAARAVRYLLCFPLWEDECFLCVNFIDRSFAALLEPLSYHQVAPPLFLWAERLAVICCGYSEWSLRLVPLAASLASLFLFRRLAGGLLSGGALLLAFGTFAVAYPGIRYAAEAKQYATDLFAALVLLTLAAEWYRSRQPGWLWLLAALAAPLLWLSYPAAFLVGGVSLAVGAVILRTAFRTDATTEAAVSQLSNLNAQLFVNPQLIAWLAYNIAVAVGFGLLFFVIRRQSGAELGFMTDYWRTAFPPFGDPERLPAWLLEVHTSDLVAWPVGGGRGASVFTAILAAIGLRQLFRRQDLFWGLLLLAPAVLNVLAAAMQRYPYGGHVKFSMYLGPAVCLLAGWGAAAWNAKVSKSRPGLARGGALVTVALLALVAGASMGRDLLRPYKTLSDERARAFAKWFWFNAEAEGPVVLVEQHNGRVFSPESRAELSWTAMFLCNRAIYSPAKRNAAPPAIPGDEQTTRYLVYRDPRFEFDFSARNAWLDSMRQDHKLVASETFPFTRFGKNERDLVTVDYLDIFTFRPSSSQTATAARAVWK